MAFLHFVGVLIFEVLAIRVFRHRVLWIRVRYFIFLKGQKMSHSSIGDFRDYYFIGVSHAPASTMSLSLSQIQSLIGSSGCNSVIASCLPVDPLLMINQKKFTIWQICYAILSTQDPEAIALLKTGQTAIYIPRSYLEGSVGNHNNWPPTMLSRYDLSLQQQHVFLIPFSVSKALPPPRPMTQSLKAPDGSMEILGLHEWSTDNPTRLLEVVQNLVRFVRERWVWW